MGAGCLFLVFSPQKAPFSTQFCFLVSPKFLEFLVQNLDFRSERAFSLPPGRGCCTRSKKSPLLQPRECIPHKTRHLRRIENALRFERQFQVASLSPHMSLGHYESENSKMSPARASGTTWAPISQRSLPDGRDFSSNDLIFPHILGLY